MRDIHIAPLIAQHLAKFHSIPLQDHNQKPSLIPLTRKFVELIMNSPHHPEDFISLCSDIDWIENEILPNMIPNPQYGSDLVLCHNDLVCTNILYNSSSQAISFIDFEYCAVNYALFDIANHFVEYAGVHQIHFERYPTRDEQIRWLNIYFEARNLKFDNPEKTCQTIDQFSVLTHLYIGLWAFTQLAFAKVDSDYESYGRRRLNRYKELKFILFNR
ncbi:hypothetical protein I4U23_012896 [Adineta vaga]|nr:hypothetical protein I4U23_012896 [Adineta vaga]